MTLAEEFRSRNFSKKTTYALSKDTSHFFEKPLSSCGTAANLSLSLNRYLRPMVRATASTLIPPLAKANTAPGPACSA